MKSWHSFGKTETRQKAPSRKTLESLSQNQPVWFRTVKIKGIDVHYTLNMFCPIFPVLIVFRRNTFTRS